MRTRTLQILGLGALAAVALTIVAAPPASSQIQALPSYLPVGVSSSGNSSTAWFHEPSSRQVLACQTVTQGSALASVQCVAAKLP